MKINDRFILRNVAGEYLLIPTGSAALDVKGLIALSESGALLYRKIQTGSSRGELIDALLGEYDVSREVAEADVDSFLDQMRELTILEEV